MAIHVIRSSAEARRFLTQGLWWQRVLAPTAATVRDSLAWIKEAAAGGQPIPPSGFVADIGHLAFGEEMEGRSGRDGPAVPNLPINLLRTYEDHVLGKVFADWTFARGSDALRRYPKGRGQARGLAYLLEQVRGRARFDAVELSPGVLNALLDAPPEEALAEGYESMRSDGPHPLLAPLYESLIQASRRTAEVLGPEDLFDLETRAALDDLGERLAHRQVLRAAASLEATLPRHKVRPLARRMEVPTRILDEDLYPAGGFTSLSNKGSIESLLHSQLAYMEPQRSAREVDLFDTLYLMDELLYYSRDDNQFLRRRRTFVLALGPDLVETRIKDAELPYQRGVMLLGLMYVLVRKAVEWLSTDALEVEVLFLGEGEKEPLAPERALLEKLFHQGPTQGLSKFQRISPARLPRMFEELSRRSMVHVLTAGAHPPLLEARDCGMTRLAVATPCPALADGSDDLAPVEGEDPVDCWANALRLILARWV
jgi:hypothetical protein